MPPTSAASHPVPPVAASGRVDWVDYAKGFCIIFVVMMHSVAGVERLAGDTGWMHAIVQFAKPFRMPDFFMISGLFLGLVIARPWRRFLDRRVVHFFYFYALWVTIQFAVKAPIWLYQGQSPVEVVGSWLFTFVEPFGTLWFIYQLPIFALVTRLLRPVPWQLQITVAAILEILPIHTGWTIIDEFAWRYVFFLSGYLFASRIFDFAQWAIDNRLRALAILMVWVVVNGIFTFTPVPPDIIAAIGSGETIEFISDLPFVSLALGAAGAVGVILTTALLSTLSWTSFLAYLGRNSIVVYLAFFLSMGASRTILLKYASFLDIGTISLLVTISGVVGPIILYWIVQWTGYGRFLFERPAWAHIEPERGPRSAARAQLNPAE